MDSIRDVLLILVGWLLGTLSPGITGAIQDGKRRHDLLAVEATELAGLRYVLALVLLMVKQKLQKVDQATLDLIKPIILTYSGSVEDQAAQAVMRKLLEAGDATFIALHNRTPDEARSLYPVPYDAPFLLSHIDDLALFPPRIQQCLLRVVSELRLLNEQIEIVRRAHDRTFASGISFESQKANSVNLQSGTEKLGVRVTALVTAINEVVTLDGKPAV